jgi:hypothetical protein
MLSYSRRLGRLRTFGGPQNVPKKSKRLRYSNFDVDYAAESRRRANRENRIRFEGCGGASVGGEPLLSIGLGGRGRENRKRAGCDWELRWWRRGRASRPGMAADLESEAGLEGLKRAD